VGSTILNKESNSKKIYHNNNDDDDTNVGVEGLKELGVKGVNGLRD
jgi:hypothetical protein